VKGGRLGGNGYGGAGKQDENRGGFHGRRTPLVGMPLV
jgi:hypothetical protein